MVSERNNALWLSARNSHLLVTRVLLENGADMMFKGRNGWTVMEDALMKHNVEVMRILLEFGADVNGRSDDGRTPLMLALATDVPAEQEKEISSAIACAAETNARYPFTSKHREFRSWSDCEEIVWLLLENGADVNAQDSDGLTALHKVLALGAEDSYDLLKMLLEMGADVNIRDKSGLTALHLAAWSGREYDVQEILDRGADIEATNNNGQTALHLAMRNGMDLAAVMLWHRGADVNMMDVEGRSPLILAAMYSAATGIIRLLSGVCADNETIEVGVGLPRPSGKGFPRQGSGRRRVLVGGGGGGADWDFCLP